MSKKLDDLEAFHSYGIHIPSRTIKLDQEADDDGEETIGINARTLSKFAKNLHVLVQASHEPITVIMNSGGGDVDSGYGIFDLIKACPAPITMQVLGQASSMAAIILQAATIRQAYPFSRLMLHDGPITTEGNSRDVEAMAEFSKLDRFRTYKIFANRTGKPVSYWNRRLQKDYYLSAEQALEEGLIDEIIGVSI